MDGIGIRLAKAGLRWNTISYVFSQAAEATLKYQGGNKKSGSTRDIATCANVEERVKVRAKLDSKLKGTVN